MDNSLRRRTDHETRVSNRRDYLELGGPRLLALAEDVFTRAEADCPNPEAQIEFWGVYGVNPSF